MKTLKVYAAFIISLSILVTQIGCTTQKPMSMNEASVQKNKKDYVFLHTQTRYYKLYNYKFLDDSIQGNIELNSKDLKEELGIHIYTNLTEDFDTQSDSINYLNIEIEKSDIVNITGPSVSRGKTLAFVIPFSIAVLFLFYLGWSSQFSLDSGY